MQRPPQFLNGRVCQHLQGLGRDLQHLLARELLHAHVLLGTFEFAVFGVVRAERKGILIDEVAHGSAPCLGMGDCRAGGKSIFYLFVSGMTSGDAGDDHAGRVKKRKNPASP